MKTLNRCALAALLLTVAACAPKGNDAPATPKGTVYLIKPGDSANADMVAAMVQVVPGDTIQFDCGYFDLKTTLQLANTENIHIKGCGKDQSVLSFRNSNQPVGILAVNSRGIWVEDLTVLDTSGNGFELRGVDHGTLSRVRALWSSGRGKANEVAITADNFASDGAKLLHVACTDPPTQNPDVPENAGGDTTSKDYAPSDLAGRYGIYPVSSDNILVEDSESAGASDAGIYVGQSNNVIIQNSRAAYNVFGFEIENVRSGEYIGNVAECNTGGFLVYDLDGNLRQYGDRTIMRNNISRMNNTYNFTHGGFVANVPPGSGMITLAYDRIDIHDNEFSDNNTAGIIHTSYQIFPEGAGRPTEKRIDFFSEGVHIWHNTFKNNGNRLPDASTTDMQNQDLARLLPAVVGYKNQAACAGPGAATCAAAPPPADASPRAASGYRGAHIVWDGLLDTYDGACAYPKRPDGTDVPRDERGKPQFSNQENPTCHYNAYKFKNADKPAEADHARVMPDWFSCIDDDNSYSTDSLTFANFHGTKGVNAAIALASNQAPTPEQMAEVQDFPSDFSLTPHKCVDQYGANLPELPAVVIPPFVPTPAEKAPTQAQIDALCNAPVADGKVNFAAAGVNCPRLDQYHLFSNPEDPRSVPNGSGADSTGDNNVPGVPFVLNTKLFSDYSVKYRVLYMPTGTKAVYADAATYGSNATITFPVGTIIAKTFAFADEDAGTENVVETRLLIKRVNSATHQARWDGLPYIWTTGADGKKVANLALGGGHQTVSWKYHDVDSGVLHEGTTDYQIPNSKQCESCHYREDGEPGTMPIGPKIRNLNRAYHSESPIHTGQGDAPTTGADNQVVWLCSHNLMLGCPSNLAQDETTKIANVERLPVFNKPGDGGATAGSAQDIESRTRAYLEVNCMHCHNVKGFAASTGLYLNASDVVGLGYGICKKPTATGAEGSDGRHFDIYPGDALKSILEFRISAKAETPAARMPPIARTVVHDEGHDLVQNWIDNVVTADESKYPNSTHCE